MKCEAGENNDCGEEAIAICYHKDFKGESDFFICKKHKKALKDVNKSRPKSLGEDPWRFKEVT